MEKGAFMFLQQEMEVTMMTRVHLMAMLAVYTLLAWVASPMTREGPFMMRLVLGRWCQSIMMADLDLGLLYVNVYS